MGRDLQFKLLTLVFAFVALLAISACAVASSPSTSSGQPEPAEAEAPDAPDEPETEPEATPEPTPVPVEDEEEQAAEPSDDAVAVKNDDVAHEDDADDNIASLRDDDQDDQGVEEEEEESPGKPVRLLIDSIDIDAEFEYVGVDDEGNMDVPKEWDNVAWYEPGTVPGAVGNAVVAGHYDSYTDPAVFFELNELEEGDHVRIITEDGEELVFEVTEIESVHVDDADTSRIFGQTDERNLNLVTCEGVWDKDADMYDHRLIVYTTLVSG